MVWHSMAVWVDGGDDSMAVLAQGLGLGDVSMNDTTAMK